ncbi:hypothetical protein T484DRAFT_1918989 [Baffinella frigidus]|nr:hypothetical protein T484DRAFT_1918989 [Cryptophyta sp. CCMP2293]
MSYFTRQRLVRDDCVSHKHLRSKTLSDLTPHMHAKAATNTFPDFQRCASAEGSSGWVEHEELLARRHALRRPCPLFHFPRLMSSFNEADLKEASASSAAPQEDKSHGAEFTPLPSAAASAAVTPCSSSADAFRARSSSSGFGRLSSNLPRAPTAGHAPSVTFPLQQVSSSESQAGASAHTYCSEEDCEEECEIVKK